MGSISIEIRQQQKIIAEKALEARKSVLTEKGLDEKAAAKDPVLKRLSAELKKAGKRIEAIDARAAHAQKTLDDMRAARQKKKAAPKKKAAAKKGKAKGGGDQAKKKPKQKKGK